MMTKRCHCIWRWTIVALGIICISAGIYLYLNWIEIFTRLRAKEMALSPDSRSFSGWKSSPLPLNFDVYLFNWTNPEDFYAGSTVRPRFQELGPYRFREIPDKVEIEWHPHNYSVSFRKKATFFFDADNSRGTLEDRITSVNTVAHAAALRAREASTFQKRLLHGSFSLYNMHPWITKTADQWMFTGYRDPLVTVGTLLSMFRRDIEVPYDRIGYLYTRNDSSTYEGHFNMYTGVDDIRKMGQIHTWDYLTHNNRFEGQCGDIKGSMGEFFPPNLTPNDSISLYIPNICRSVPLDYKETTEIHGVTAYKFAGGKRSVDNGTLFPEAKCFCASDECRAPSGVFYVGPCKFNTSVYMSYPHFYQADHSYLEAIEGLKPDPERHEFFMTLEPNAGVVMDVGGGFQANYLLEPIQGIDIFEGLNRTLIPLMWAEERVRVTPEIAKDIALVPLIILLGQIVTGILLAGGLILTCWYPTKFITRLCKDPKQKTALLQMPLNHSRAIMPPPKKLYDNGIEAKSLLEPKNGSVIRPNGTVTEGLLGKTLKTPDSVVINR